MHRIAAVAIVFALGIGGGHAAEPTPPATSDAAPAPVVQAPAPVAPPPPPPTSIATDRISVLYRRETVDGPERLDSAVQAATAALERELISKGFRVIQPSPEVYRLLDQGPGMVVTFAPDAGLSLVFAVYRNVRPVPGTDTGIAEVRIDARVFVGRTMLAVEQGRGQLQTRTDAALADYGSRRAYELAAQRAATMLAPLVTQRLRGISAEQLAQYAVFAAGSATGELVVAPPPPPAPVATTSPASGAAPTSPVSPIASPVQAIPTMPAESGPLVLSSPRNRWALIVGVSDYSWLSGATSLPGVATDVANMRRALLERGFANANVKELLEGRATGVNVRQALKSLAAQTQPDDLVVMFMSAHGGGKDFSVSGYGMPILRDYDGTNSNLDFWELQSLTRNLPARQIVWIIDTCHAGGATTLLPTVVMSASGIGIDSSGGRPNPNAMRMGLDDRHFAVMSAARADQVSLEVRFGETRAGLFTTNLVNGLERSRAETTLEELFHGQVASGVTQYFDSRCRARPQTCNETRQTPVFGFSGSGNRIKL
jgi:hypothetical protein